MQDSGTALNSHCPCSQPECFENMLRSEIVFLARMVELDTTDARPAKVFWKSYDKEALLRECVARHKPR